MPRSAHITGRQATAPRITKLLTAGVLLAMAAVACGSSDDTGTSSGTTQAPLASATLNASGATFPKAFYEEAIAGYKKVQPSVTVNYAGGGSGNGRQELQDGVVDFAGSDGLVVKADDVPKYKGEFLYVPTIAAPITVSYNLTSVPDLALDADTIAKIFQRQIKKWDDPAIKALNGGASLPSTAITVAHRSDGSGTTENFTKYLVAAGANDLDAQVGLHRRVAGRHPGRQRQPGRGPDRQGHRRRRSATSTSPTPRRRACSSPR